MTEFTDLFGVPEAWPKGMAEFFEQSGIYDAKYEDLNRIEKALRQRFGYTFEYGLDAIPFDLRPLPVVYIVYNTRTLNILAVSHFYTREIHALVCESPYSSKKKRNIDFINVTMKAKADILAKINEVNNTKYG